MKPIQYRAYNKKEKKMYWNVQRAYDTLNYHGAMDSFDALSFEEMCEEKEKYTICESSFGDILERPDVWEVMQFTGLLDIRGKKIFEGDIIAPKHDCKLCEDELTEVKWSGPFTGFKPFFCPGNEHDADEWEVIGNIWENPELLEVKEN